VNANRDHETGFPSDFELWLWVDSCPAGRTSPYGDGGGGGAMSKNDLLNQLIVQERGKYYHVV